MDDTLEKPSNLPTASFDRQDEDDENSSGDEDGGLDWTRIPSAPGRPVIPKRGEKDFEPSVEGGSGLQLHVLDRARAAMLEALKATRNTSSKSISYGVWYPGIARAHITVARGVHFGSMGHSVPRPMPSNEGEASKLQKRMELLPEEALYLVERGTLFCTKGGDTLKLNVPGMEDVDGAPMTVQQAFSEMVGSEGLTLEKYQVFAYLKRLGFSITRADPPTQSYPSSQPYVVHTETISRLHRVFTWLSSRMDRIRRLFGVSFDWWKPLRFGGWLHHNKNIDDVFKTLRFIPSGHSVALQPQKDTTPKVASPYKIFYNLYKPSTPFRKTAPGPPDFSLVVINARTTPIPSLHELTALFDVLPELPPPPPRQRRPPPGDKATTPAIPPKPAPITAAPAPKSASASMLRRIFPWMFDEQPDPTQPLPRKPNPFMLIKAAKKNVVIAAVDAGSISFFRFGQGAFDEFPVL